MMDYIKPTAERLLVCVGSSTSSAKLVHSAKKMAADLQAKWFALHVENPKPLMQTEGGTQPRCRKPAPGGAIGSGGGYSGRP